MGWYGYSRKRDCAICGSEFEASRSDAHLCSASCRKKASRESQKLTRQFEKARDLVNELETLIKEDHRLKSDALHHIQSLNLITAAILKEQNSQRHIYQAGD